MQEALTTVLGVMLAALLAFWFDRQKRREETEFRLKQEVLLQASEAVHRFFMYYMSIPDRPLPQGGSTDAEATEVTVALNKLHFFCSLETIECVCRFSCLLGKAMTDAVAAKMPSGFIAVDIKAMDVQIAAFEATNARLQQETEMLLQSDPMSPSIHLCKEQISETYRVIAECYGGKGELFKQQYAETEKCRDVVFSYLKPLSKMSRELLLLARDELRFKIDRAKYHSLMNQVADEGMQHLDNFVNTIRTQIKEKMEEEVS
ncbi:MAG: hypothetical protein K9M54_01845 [Kiritimatiellales bacterium]|nr:hypothetical protein [Kiritimatiellales bacterium]MCF7864010.1 hypothetical protein [Kiritimatiellales bacterium]